MQDSLTKNVGTHGRTIREEGVAARVGLCSLSVLLLLAADTPQVAADCGAAGLTSECKNKESSLLTTAEYDIDGNSIIEWDELQCAIDCLDGDLLPEHTASLAGFQTGTYEVIRGGVLDFDPGLTYRLDKPLRLPLAAEGQVILRGHGSRIEIIRSSRSPSGRFAAIERTAPRQACNAAVQAFGLKAWGWTIQDLTFQLSVPDAGRPLDTFFKGIEVHGSAYLLVEGCRFEPVLQAGYSGFDVGVELRLGTWAEVNDCQFVSSRIQDLALWDLSAPCLDGGPLTGCWMPTGATGCAGGGGASGTEDVSGCLGGSATGTTHVMVGSSLTGAPNAVAIGINEGGHNRIYSTTIRGDRPSAAIRDEKLLPYGSLLSLRDLRIEGVPGGKDTGLLQHHSASLLLVDAGSLLRQDTQEQLLLDGRSQSPSVTSVRAMTGMSELTKLVWEPTCNGSVASWCQQFSFSDLGDAFRADEDSTWLRDAPLVPQSPTHITVENPTYKRIPLPPQDLIWFDSRLGLYRTPGALESLLYCCDTSGTPLGAEEL